jgi:hypothetical protein
MTEARRIREEHRDLAPPLATPVRMNQVITEVPFGGGTVESHLDTSSGHLDMDTGHLDAADVTITLDYDTAKAVFVDGTREAAMQAFMAGKVKVQGDLTKLINALQEQSPSATPEAGDVTRKIQEITE